MSHRNHQMIETAGLTKTFTVRKQTVEAVRGLHLTVAPGELVALLGPNGAGKSTTLRMLTTLIAPTSGTARVAGYDVTTQPRLVRRAIGYIGQGNGAGHNQRGRDELVSHGLAYGMTKAAARQRAGELVDSLDLAQVADRKVSSLSGGQRRRLDIAMGLIHAPALLFLDEPSTGLDPQNRANLQEHVVALRERYGTTVVLTTHYLDEADSLAEPADAAHAAARIARGHGDAEVAHEGREVAARVASGSNLAPAMLVDLQQAGFPAASVEVARPTLDDVFLNLTGRSLREGHTQIQGETNTEQSGQDEQIGAAA